MCGPLKGESVVNGSWRYCFFDFDGTLFDSAPDITRSLNDVAAHLDREEVELDRVRHVIGGGLGRLLTDVFGELTTEEIREGRRIFMASYGNGLWDLSRPYRDAHEVVRVLGSYGGVVSNKPRRFLDPLIRHLQWEFGVVVAGDDGYRRKPSGAGLKAALEKVGATPEVAVYVGDRPMDHAAAMACGVDFLTVEWGTCVGVPSLDGLEDLIALVRPPI